MSKVLADLKPQSLWHFFEDICNIPHPSKKEEKIISYVKSFGEELQLETIVDHAGNILIRKAATPGYENRKTVVLQSHLDMVPQKNNDTEHDFEKDPIKVFVDQDWVKANGTTLGADNGIGVAAAMAVLKSTDIEHGPIECLFTIDEETGMTGAFALKEGLLKGDILINLDSEDEGELYIGCAGGIDTTAYFDFTTTSTVGALHAFEIQVKGLKGGHSGLDIHLGRGNANKIMNRILWHAHKEMQLQLAHIEGGSLRNAIPREAAAKVVLPMENKERFERFIEESLIDIKNELKNVEPDLVINIHEIPLPDEVINPEVTSRLLNGIYGCPNGVIRMVDDMPGVVETSTNLAIIKSASNKIEVSSLQRSSVDSAKTDLCNMIHSVFEMAGAKVEHSGSYPGWKPNASSPILQTMKQVYNEKFGKTPEVKVIHAGLECGILGGVYPNLDMISFGPTIRNPHSPDEKVNIKTVGLFWDFLVATLESIPDK